MDEDVIAVEVYAKATIYMEREFFERYSPGDFLEAADNSFDRWQLISVQEKDNG